VGETREDATHYTIPPSAVSTQADGATHRSNQLSRRCAFQWTEYRMNAMWFARSGLRTNATGPHAAAARERERRS
jgi:hypothetical protein